MRKLVYSAACVSLAILSADLVIYLYFMQKVSVYLAPLLSFVLICLLFSIIGFSFFFRARLQLLISVLLSLFFFLAVAILAIEAQCLTNSLDSQDVLFSCGSWLEITRIWSKAELEIVLQDIFVTHPTHSALHPKNFRLILDKVWGESRRVSQLLLEVDTLCAETPSHLLRWYELGMLVHAPTDDYSSFYYEWDPVEKRYFLYKKDFKEAKADDVF